MRLIPIDAKEQDGYLCADCWIDEGKDVKAVVLLRSTYGILDMPCQHGLCGNHAEMIDPSILDKEQHEA